MSLNSDYQKLEPGNTVRLFEVDGTAFGAGEVLRFHNYNLAYTEDEIAAANPLSPINLTETSLDNRVAFQRAGAASYIGQDGKIYQASANQWPLEYLGGVGRTEPEPAATNLLTYSNTMTNAVWTMSSATRTGNQISPSGGTDAIKLVPSTANANHIISQVITAGVIGNTSYVLSFFVKAAGYNRVRLRAADSVAYRGEVVVNLADGTITAGNTTALLTPLADGWFRVSSTFLIANGATNLSISAWVYDDSGAATFAGDGVKGILITGAQIEKGSVLTSPILTGATTVTRPAASAVIAANGASSIKVTYSTGETTTLTFGSASSVVLPAASEPWGTRYITKIEYIGGTPVYDESKLPAKSIWWQGNEYSAWPVQIEGIEASTSGSGAQPKLTVANLDGSITALCLAYDDMLQAVVTIHDTLAQYLDARNFAGGNATADASQEKLQVFYIDSKSMETNISVEFTLTSPMDLQGLMIPTRQLHSLCTWCIRGKYRSGDGCDYAGTNYFDKHGNPVSDPSLDVCNGTLNTGCKPRHGANNELPFGGFPGTSLLR